jgi:hypothetical protein
MALEELVHTFPRRKGTYKVITIFFQPKRIYQLQGIGTNVQIGVQPAFKPNRIRLNVPPRTGVVVPEVVVV